MELLVLAVNRSNSVTKPSTKSKKMRPWSVSEDEILKRYVTEQGTRQWNMVQMMNEGFDRDGPSCGARWRNCLDPQVKKAKDVPFSPAEEALVVELHAIHGNKWSTIASKVLQ